MVKKTVSVLVSLALLLCVAPISGVSVLADEIDGEYTYTVTDEEATIVDYVGSDVDVVIPATIDGYPVTGLGGYLFYDNYLLNSITIPASVTHIGGNAFAFCSINEVRIADSAAWCRIRYEGGEQAAYSTNPLFRANILTVNGVQVTEVTIPDDVTAIPEYAFSCDHLQKVTIPNRVKRIGTGAFDGCSVLTDVWYDGTEYQKGRLAIGDDNEALMAAVWHCTAEGGAPMIDHVLVDPDMSNGIRLTIVYTDGTFEQVTTDYTMVGFDPTAVGEQEVTMEYQGVMQTFTVSVAESPSTDETETPAIESISVDPDVSNGVKLTVVYTDGTTETVTTRYTVEGFDPEAEGAQAIVVYYNGVAYPCVVQVLPSKPLPGDANGDGEVNDGDLELLLQYLNNWDVVVSEAACDVTGDGKINNKDPGLLLQYLNDWDVELKG